MRQGIGTVFHLFLTDLRSLRILVVVVWSLLLLSALPSLVATTDDFSSFPNDFRTSTSKWHDEQIDKVRAERGGFASWGNTKLANFGVLALAFAIGCVNRGWGSGRPLKRSHALAAKFALLLALVTGPQLVLVTMNLVKLGFSPGYITAGVGSAAAAFVPLQLGALFFGLLCGSPWRCIVGVTSLFVVAGVVELFQRGASRNLLEPLLDTWGASAGPRSWWFLGASAAALLLVCAVGGLRWRPRLRILGACVAVVLCWLATRSVSHFGLREASPVAVEIKPPAKLKATVAPTPDRSGVRLVAELGITKQSEGELSALWYPLNSTKLYADGRLVATSRSFGNSVAGLFPQQEGQGGSTALLRRLPKGTTILAEPNHSFSSFGLGRRERFVGEFEFPSCDDLLEAGERFELEGEAGGIVYRYEVGFDVELGSEPQRVELGGVTLNVKQIDDVPLADILVTRASLGTSEHYADLNWRFKSGRWHVYYYLPEEGVVVGSSLNYEGNSPLVAGAGAERWIYEPKVIHRMADYGRPSAGAGNLNFEGVRVIGVRAKIVGTTRQPFRIPIAVKARWRHNNDNYYMAKDNQVDPNQFFKTYRHQRPDPRTASPDQLGDWMRKVFTQSLISSWTARDLAQFAPRHTPVLLRLPGHSTSRDQAWGAGDCARRAGVGARSCCRRAWVGEVAARRAGEQRLVGAGEGGTARTVGRGARAIRGVPAGDHLPRGSGDLFSTCGTCAKRAHQA